MTIGKTHSTLVLAAKFQIEHMQPYNPHIPNIDSISGALFTLRIQYKYTQTQYDEGARVGIDVLYMGITRSQQK